MGKQWENNGKTMGQIMADVISGNMGKQWDNNGKTTGQNKTQT
jgi:hypothetical protein